VTIPTLFYERNLGISTQEIVYYKIVLCEEEPDTGFITVLINVPDNPTMNITAHGWPPVELGNSATQFTSTTVFATNYIWGQTAYSTIVVPYNVNNFVGRTFYLRVTAKIFSVNYNLQIGFSSSGTPTPGTYDSRAFPTQNVVGAFNYLEQYGTTGNTPLSVGNLQGAYFFVQFCDADIMSNTYTVTITLTSNPSKPRSAFNLYACIASQIVQSSCNEYIYSEADEETAPVATVTVQNTAAYPLNQGIWILVDGYGGELDGQNSFFLQAKLETT